MKDGGLVEENRTVDEEIRAALAPTVQENVLKKQGNQESVDDLYEVKERLRERQPHQHCRSC